MTISRKTLFAATAGAALVGGLFGAGVAGANDSTAVMSAPPPVTQTVTATPLPAITETLKVPGPVTTKNVEVKVKEFVTTEACLDALDHADTMIDLAGQALDLSSKGFDAIWDLDPDAMENITADMKKITPQMASFSKKYAGASAECRSKG